MLARGVSQDTPLARLGTSERLQKLIEGFQPVRYRDSPQATRAKDYIPIPCKASSVKDALRTALVIAKDTTELNCLVPLPLNEHQGCLDVMNRHFLYHA